MKKRAMKLEKYVDTNEVGGNPGFNLRASAEGITVYLGKSRRTMGWGQAWQTGNQFIHAAFAAIQRKAPSKLP